MATPTNLPASFVAGSILTAAQQNALRGAFRIMQVVRGSHSTQTESTSTTYIASGLTASVTPQATSSTVLIDVRLQGSTSAAGATLQARIIRRIGITDTTIGTWAYALYNSSGGLYGTWSQTIIDSPATTSACTYRVEFSSNGGTAVYTQTGGSQSNIILQEISA